MKASKMILIGLVAAGASCAGLLLATSEDSPNTSTSKTDLGKEDGDTSDNEALEREVSGLRAQMGQIQKQLLMLSANQRDADVKRTPNDGDEERGEERQRQGEALHDPEVQAKRAEVAEKMQADLLLERFDHEEVDTDWSREAESIISNNFASMAIEGARGIDSQCRNTLCKIEVEFESTQAINNAARQLPQLVNWDANGFIHGDENGDPFVTIYVTRDAEPLPRPNLDDLPV